MACSGTVRLRIARAFSRWREHEMRCAIFKDNTDFFSMPCAEAADDIHSVACRRADDHPPPCASNISGWKTNPAAQQMLAVSKCDCLLLSIIAKTSSGQDADRSKNWFVIPERTEKSHASAPPLGPLGCQTSAGRRAEVVGGKPSSVDLGGSSPGFSRSEDNPASLQSL